MKNYAKEFESFLEENFVNTHEVRFIVSRGYFLQEWLDESEMRGVTISDGELYGLASSFFVYDVKTIWDSQFWAFVFVFGKIPTNITYGQSCYIKGASKCS